MDIFTVTDFELILRLVFATVLGLFIGAERTRVGKRAGMRTYALVALGSALFVIISGVVAVKFHGQFIFDPNRVLSQIVVGVGFLGAGVIFVQRSVLTGLTTAAGLWVVAGVGAAVGYGLYTIAAFVTFAMFLIFEVLWYIEDRYVRVTENIVAPSDVSPVVTSSERKDKIDYED